MYTFFYSSILTAAPSIIYGQISVLNIHLRYILFFRERWRCNWIWNISYRQ